MVKHFNTHTPLKALLLVPLLAYFLFSFNQGTDPRLNKKIDQVLKKEWKDKEVTKSLFLIPPHLKQGEDSEIYRLNSEDELLGYLVLNKAYSCKVGGCSAWSPVADQSNYEPFYYVIIIDPDLTIKKIKIIEYYSEYGYEITSKRWLSQFIGKTGCNLGYEKEIDGISGATISVKSMIYDVNSTCQMVEQLAI